MNHINELVVHPTGFEPVTSAFGGDAVWSANFRDLSASITRMAIFAHSGRITVAEVEFEIERLAKTWHTSSKDPSDTIVEEALGAEMITHMDLFGRLQLAQVIKICRSEKSLSAAGRTLYAATRSKKKVANDTDRLRKYL